MHTETMQASPVVAAQLDWRVLGEFTPEQFQGEQRRQYEEEAARIERAYDNQPA